MAISDISVAPKSWPGPAGAGALWHLTEKAIVQSNS